MGNIATQTETWSGGDYRWLASARGFSTPKSGTADITEFAAGTHYPNGYLPSGTRLTFDSGSGLYEPYVDDGENLPDLAGFVAHDTDVRGTKVTIAVLTDVTIVAAHLPGATSLVDGRYILDRVDTDPAPVLEGGDS